MESTHINCLGRNKIKEKVRKKCIVRKCPRLLPDRRGKYCVEHKKI